MPGIGLPFGVIPSPVQTGQLSFAPFSRAASVGGQPTLELRRSLHVLAPAADPETVRSSLLAEALGGQAPGADIVPLAPAPDPTDVSVLGVRASDGVSVYRPPGEGRYATADQLDTEEYLLSSARKRVRQAMTGDEADQATATAGLNAEQRAGPAVPGPWPTSPCHGPGFG